MELYGIVGLCRVGGVTNVYVGIMMATCCPHKS